MSAFVPPAVFSSASLTIMFGGGAPQLGAPPRIRPVIPIAILHVIFINTSLPVKVGRYGLPGL
jgi:hypothetical protein